VLLSEGLVEKLVDKVTSFVKENGRVHSKINVYLQESRKRGNYSDDIEPAADNDKQQSPALRCVDRDNVVFYGL
jgi:hypothetical protein